MDTGYEFQIVKFNSYESNIEFKSNLDDGYAVSKDIKGEEEL